MFTKIATVVTFCDREVQFWSFVAAYIWIFLYEKVQSRLIFLFFRLGYIKFSLFASSVGEICVLHRYGTYLLLCSVLWRAAGRLAKSSKCRKVSSVHKFQAIFDGFDRFGWRRKNVKNRELLPWNPAFFCRINAVKTNKKIISKRHV